MRIGVVSDTHGNSEVLRKALGQMGDIDLLIHAGDHYRDAINVARGTGLKVVAVTGNCDRHQTGQEEEELEIEGHRILVTHGHQYAVKSGHSKLAEKMRQGKYNLIIYGHSHIPDITKLPGGYVFNPGSLSSPRCGSVRSYGIVEVDKNGLAPYIHELKWSG